MILVFLVGTMGLGSVAEAQQRSVLVLDESSNFGSGGLFYFNLFTAFRTKIANTPASPISVYLENLDFVRFRSADYERNLKPLLETKYGDKHIDVIVAVGPSALDYVLRLRTAIWSNVPVVFAMVDEPTIARLKPPADVTGTIAKLRFRDSLDVARAVVPNLRGVAVLGDRWESQVVYRNFKDEIPVAAAGLEVMDLTGMRMRELTQRVSALSENVAIIYTAMYSDGEGTALSPVEALGRIAATANRPIVVSVETQVGRGGIGGYVLSPAAIGETLAQEVLQIFDGNAASKTQSEPHELVRPIFDWRQMQRWGVAASNLPSGSEIRFRSPTAWDQYRDQILLVVGAIVIQAGLIAWLLFERRRRRHSEIVAHDTMAELANVSRFAIAGELSASIAHEVNQPLTGMVASANAGLRWLAAPVPDVEKARAALTQIVAAGHRASDVVRGIRAIFKRDSGERRAIDVNELIAAVLALAENDLNKHQIAVETQLASTLPLAFGDRAQLQQVLLNLVLNAVDSMSEVPAAMRLLRVISEAKDASEIQLSVKDTGVGLKPDDAERVFKPLFTTKSRGMGMGLSICRSIIESHDGRIWASPAGSGATFTFVLPAHRAEHAA